MRDVARTEARGNCYVPRGLLETRISFADFNLSREYRKQARKEPLFISLTVNSR